MQSPDYPLLTRSLALRPYEETDLADYSALVGDAGVTRYLTWGPRDAEEARETFRKRRLNGTPSPDRQQLQLAMTMHDGPYVGEISLINLDYPQRSGELGYILTPAFHGHGLASEAADAMLRVGFDVLGLHRIVARCDDRNTGSARVMEKIGMRREAHHLSSVFYRGEWAGVLVYAILEDEWCAQSRSGSRK